MTNFEEYFYDCDRCEVWLTSKNHKLKKKEGLNITDRKIYCNNCESYLELFSDIAEMIKGYQKMTKEIREKRIRLSMDVPTIVHIKLKEMAILHNCTITSYVLRAVIAQLKVEEQFK